MSKTLLRAATSTMLWFGFVAMMDSLGDAFASIPYSAKALSMLIALSLGPLTVFVAGNVFIWNSSGK